MHSPPHFLYLDYPTKHIILVPLILSYNLEKGDSPSHFFPSKLPCKTHFPILFLPQFNYFSRKVQYNSSHFDIFDSLHLTGFSLSWQFYFYFYSSVMFVLSRGLISHMQCFACHSAG